MVWAGAATFHEFVDLADAIAWPAAVAVSVVVLRKPIASALGRATKITAFLLPSSVSPPLLEGQSTLPQSLFKSAVAVTSVTR